MAKKHPEHDLSTGRNMPRRFSSYSPSHRRDITEDQPNSDEISIKPFKRRLKISIILLLVGFFTAIVVIGAWDAKNISSAESKLFGTSNLLALVSGSPLKGSDNNRVNVLLVGYSIDDPGHPAATLTDSLILLSMSTTSHSGYMLSIPRDLYVNLPGFGHAKINEAYQDGGISLLEQVITADFNLPLDYYVLIDYTAVKQTVNALSGITLNIQSSDPRGLYDPNINPHDGGPLKLSNGPQTLDGQTALNLSRARGDAPDAFGFPQADFDRTQHQRQILTAIQSKLSWKLILNPRKNSQLLNALADNIKTDAQAGEAKPLFSLFKNIPSANMQSVSLRSLNGTNYLSSYTTFYGQSALVPAAGIDDYSAIDAALQQLNQ